MLLLVKVLCCFLALGNNAFAKTYLQSLSPNSRQLLTQSMNWMDMYYDSSAGYLYDVSGTAALRHETRSSAWYAVGLLARNGEDDVQNAERIIRNVIQDQYGNTSEQWYGDYQQYPEEPYVGSQYYPAVIYKSFDPNWRGFVGTTFVLIMEEFSSLLSDDTQDLILASLRESTRGDEYRVGGVDGDNLYPSYSNPAIMRALVSGWTGRRLKDANFTASGEKYAQDTIDLFNRNDTLSEFNSGTYTGVSLFGLVLWSKYLPKDSVMAQNGPRMLKDTWKAVSQLWHPGLKNMAGPWDRAYGYDMNRYLSLMALWFWAFIGKDKSSLIATPQAMSHSADYAWAPLFAVLAEYHQSLLPPDLVSSLAHFSGEHTFTASTYYPPLDNVPRNITSWLSEKLTIGGESFDENGLGGPSLNQQSFNPAVIQWYTSDEVSWISLYPTESALQVDVSPGQLGLKYPKGNSSSIFTFVVGTFKRKTTIADWSDVQGLNVNISGNVDAEYNLSFAGHLVGPYAPINNFEYWNFTYSMPEGFHGIPSVFVEVELK